MRKKKILILGAKGFPSVTCYDWGDEDLPNIADYDVVIINVVSLTEKLHSFNSNALNNISSSLLKLLDSKGTLYAIACLLITKEITIPKFNSQGNLNEEKTVLEMINNYMWSPIPLEVNNEKGDTIEIKYEQFKDYFKHLKEWYFTVKPAISGAPKEAFNYGDYISKSVTIMDEIAIDRRGRAIAAKFCYALRIDEIINSSTSKIKKVSESGDFILLPQPTEINDVEAINFILEKCLGVFQKTPSPDWAKAIPFPGLNEIESKLEKIENKINALNKEKSEFEGQKKELASYRELLYETGTMLEEIVRKVFTELEYPTEPDKLGEEYVIKFNNTIGIIECKGVTKSISRRDFRQLLERKVEYETRLNINAKGILIANAWRDLNPEERDTQDKPIFPAGEDGVIEIAERNHIALINTIDLFNIFCKFLDKKIKAKEIVETIFKADGIVKFPT